MFDYFQQIPETVYMFFHSVTDLIRNRDKYTRKDIMEEFWLPLGVVIIIYVIPLITVFFAIRMFLRAL